MACLSREKRNVWRSRELHSFAGKKAMKEVNKVAPAQELGRQLLSYRDAASVRHAGIYAARHVFVDLLH
jgi:hypothetical protein